LFGPIQPDFFHEHFAEQSGGNFLIEPNLHGATAGSVAHGFELFSALRG
jgi:hypothetical protein